MLSRPALAGAVLGGLRKGRPICKIRFLPPMPTAHLNDRALISVSGPDAEHFLQNIVTTDLDVLAAGEAKPGALLTPQGKILFDFLVSRAGDNALPARMPRRCRRRFRAPADALQAARQGRDCQAGSGACRGCRGAMIQAPRKLIQPTFADRALPPCRRQVSRATATPPRRDADAAAWHAFRIANGVAESGADYALGDAFPHDVLLDETRRRRLQEGLLCRPGGRLAHAASRHRAPARADRRRPTAPCPRRARRSPPAAGRRHARLGRGHDGPRDRRASTGSRTALDAGAADHGRRRAVSLAIPAWAKFTFPQEAAAAEDA